MIEVSNADRLTDAGYIHETELPDLDRVCDRLEGVLEAVYETGDIISLESNLEELCHALDVPMKKVDPLLETSAVFDALREHIEYQRKVIDEFKGRGK